MATHQVDTDVLVYAFRYALGRMTFAPYDVVTVIQRDWHKLNTTTRRLIQKEITEAKERGAAGMSCDVAQWNKLLDLPATSGGNPL